MAIDTGTFLAGVAVLVTLDVLALGVAIVNARQMVTNADLAPLRSMVVDAIESSAAAHRRLDKHHGRDDVDGPGDRPTIEEELDRGDGLRADGGPIELPDGATEGDTERDGFLSYAGEWHALSIGLATGLVVGSTGRWELGGAIVAVALGERRAAGKGLGEVAAEPWYAAGGLVVGAVAGWAVSALG